MFVGYMYVATGVFIAKNKESSVIITQDFTEY